MPSIVYLAEARFGGWVTYTAHLAKMLGVSHIYRIGNKTEPKLRDFGQGVAYQNLSVEDAKNLPELLVVAVDKNNLESALELAKVGSAFVIHDPTELNETIVKIAKVGKPKIVTIRKKVQDLLWSEHELESAFIVHPYVRSNLKRDVIMNAASCSRVDWDKNTDIIVQANANLDKIHWCNIFGFENRIYGHMHLDTNYPGWRTFYQGQFPAGFNAGAQIFSRANFAVDMSVIKKDGGGTQYTFLEAWDACSHLVVHKEWLVDGGQLVDGVNCTAVGDHVELAQILRTEPDIAIRENGNAELVKHASGLVRSLYTEYLGWE